MQLSWALHPCSQCPSTLRSRPLPPFSVPPRRLAEDFLSWASDQDRAPQHRIGVASTPREAAADAAGGGGAAAARHCAPARCARTWLAQDFWSWAAEQLDWLREPPRRGVSTPTAATSSLRRPHCVRRPASMRIVSPSAGAGRGERRTATPPCVRPGLSLRALAPVRGPFPQSEGSDTVGAQCTPSRDLVCTT